MLLKMLIVDSGESRCTLPALPGDLIAAVMEITLT